MVHGRGDGGDGDNDDGVVGMELEDVTANFGPHSPNWLNKVSQA